MCMRVASKKEYSKCSVSKYAKTSKELSLLNTY